MIWSVSGRLHSSPYEDRFLKLDKQQITFGTGKGKSVDYEIVRVRKALEDGNSVYTIHYVSNDGQEYRTSLYHHTDGGGVLRMKNREAFEWKRAKTF